MTAEKMYQAQLKRESEDYENVLKQTEQTTPRSTRRHPHPLHSIAFNVGGSLRLESQDSNTSSDDAHKHACIPAEAVCPIKKTAPESMVPTRRPAALAM